jgi:RNA binding exosome subunit
MNNLKYNISGYQCHIELSIEQFKKLESIDYLDVVIPTLKKLGASDIEYNGHFGAAIFFYAENLEDAQKITEKIEEMLK